MTQPVIEAMTARRFLQDGYLVWSDLEIDDGHNGDVDILACNAEELVVAECKDQFGGAPETVIAQMNRAWQYLQDENCPYSPLTRGRQNRRIFVVPFAELGNAATRQVFSEALAAENIELLDADEVIRQVVVCERDRLDARAPRYGQQPDTILNLIKWMVYRGWFTDAFLEG